MPTMTRSMLLVVSTTLTTADLLASPFHLPPERVLVTSPASLAYLGLGRFFAMVLHQVDEDLLTRLALGLRDRPEAEGLWAALALENGPRLLGLVPAPGRPPQAWRDLGIEPIRPSELRSLFDDASSRWPIGGSGGASAPEAPSRGAVLTADDIRDMHQSGSRFLPREARLTPWARELADTLGLAEGGTDHELPVLIAVAAATGSALKSERERYFALATALPHALFVLAPALLPIWAEYLPSLRGRMVAARVHWATHGAFTGEVSLEMLLDQGCRGALLPAGSSPFPAERQADLISRAARAGFLLFAPHPLEPAPGCDIMAPLPGYDSGFARLLSSQGVKAAAPSPPEATVVIPFRHEQHLKDIRKGTST
jgi:hypothetical protein